jgi:hypothetical protein
MSHLANLLVVLIGGGLLGFMMNTLPDYNSSFQPFSVHADTNGVGQGRLFTAEMTELETARAISYAHHDAEIVRDTSAIFLVAKLAITARQESQQIEAIWLGATGRQYNHSMRLEDAPRALPSLWFQPGLNGKAHAMFELPKDEISGGRLVLMASGNPIMDSAVYFEPPATWPENQGTLRLEP